MSAELAIGLKALAAALAVGLSAIGSGIAESGIGASAVAAMAEDEKFFAKGLLMTVLPETLIIFGFVLALIILFM